MGNRNLWLQTGIRALALVGLASLIAALFLAVGEWYMRSLNQDRTILLDHSLFQENNKDTAFRIEGVARRHTAGLIWYAKPLSGDRLLVLSNSSERTENIAMSSKRLAVFDIVNNQMETVVEDSNLQSFDVSPDGNRVVYQTVNTYEPDMIWYDLKNKRVLGRAAGGASPIALDDYRFLGTFGSTVRIWNMQTGESRKIVELNKLEWQGDLAGDYDNSSHSTISVIRFAMVPSPDLSHLYLQHSSDAILSVDVGTGAIVRIASGDIYEFVPSGNDELLVSGSFNGVDGLYFLPVGKDPVLLREGTFSNLTVNPRSSVVSYVNQQKDGRWRVIAAKLEGSKLSDEFTVYADPGFIRTLQWSPDGKALICVTEGIAGSDVYQFRLSGGN